CPPSSYIPVSHSLMCRGLKRPDRLVSISPDSSLLALPGPFLEYFDPAAIAFDGAGPRLGERTQKESGIALPWGKAPIAGCARVRDAEPSAQRRGQRLIAVRHLQAIAQHGPRHHPS